MTSHDPTGTQRPPHRLSSRLRVALFVVLVASAALTLLGPTTLAPALRDGRMQPEWLLAGPAAFLIALVIFAIDRAVQTRRTGVGMGWAVVRVGFGIVFLFLLVPKNLREYQTLKAPSAKVELVAEVARSKDARVRQVAMLAAAGGLDDVASAARILTRGLNDSHPRVRQAALDAIARRLGKKLPTGDAGMTAAKDALRVWSQSAAAGGQP